MPTLISQPGNAEDVLIRSDIGHPYPPTDYANTNFATAGGLQNYLFASHINYYSSSDTGLTPYFGYGGFDNYGSSVVWPDPYAQGYKTLIRFSAISLIPVGSIIDSAVISFWYNQNFFYDDSVQVYSLKHSFFTPVATWTQPDGSNHWDISGCNGNLDRNNSSVGTLDVSTDEGGGIFRFDLHLGAPTVQSWVNGSLANNGIVIDFGTDSGGFVAYSSRFGTAAYHPRLTVVYHAPQPPSSPTSLINVSGNNQIQLSWVVSSDITTTSQKLYRGLVPGGPYALLATFGDNITHTYTDPGIEGEGFTKYYYVVTAINGIGESLFSNEDVSTFMLGNGGSGGGGGLGPIDDLPGGGDCITTNSTPTVTGDDPAIAETNTPVTGDDPKAPSTNPAVYGDDPGP